MDWEVVLVIEGRGACYWDWEVVLISETGRRCLLLGLGVLVTGTGRRCLLVGLGESSSLTVGRAPSQPTSSPPSQAGCGSIIY